VSDTRCALEGEDPDALTTDNNEGDQLLAILNNEGDTQGFDGDLGDLENLGPQAVPGPYTCELFNDPDTVSTPFWVRAPESSEQRKMSADSDIGVRRYDC